MVPSQNGVEDAETNEFTRSMDAVRAIVRALRINTRAIEQQIGISLAQLFVLQQVAERPADSLNDLASRTATHQSSVSVVVRRLVDRGFVTRKASATDKRRVQIAATAEGERILAVAPRTVQVRMMSGLEKMPAAERNQLADLLEKWLDASGISYTSPPMLGESDGDGEFA